MPDYLVRHYRKKDGEEFSNEIISEDDVPASIRLLLETGLVRRLHMEMVGTVNVSWEVKQS